MAVNLSYTKPLCARLYSTTTTVMKKLIISLLFIIFSITSVYNQDTTVVYYDVKWNSCNEKKAKYFSKTITNNKDKVKVIKSTIKGIPISIYSYCSLDPIIENGKFKLFDKKGKIIKTGSYTNGIMDGQWLLYNKKSKSFDTIDYTGVPQILISPIENLIEEFFFIVEEMPKFGSEEGDGMLNFQRYIIESIRYPERAVEKGSQGLVFVQFVVGSDGNIYNPKIIREADIDLMAESIRIVINSPKWIPGKRNGKPVAVQYTLPINFQL